MKIVILMEDTCGHPWCEFEHGFSVYLETKHHKLLIDSGKSPKTIRNAEKLNVDLSKVDTAFLSHGHYDHAGGLLAFREINRHAPIYMQRTALGEYFHGERYIGVDRRIADLEQVILLDGDRVLDGELTVFADITGRKYWPQSNRALSMKQNGQFVQDPFAHEQCLVIAEEKNVLVSGCAHNGILNILDAYQERFHKLPDAVFSGFHMMKKSDYTPEETEVIQNTAKELVGSGIRFYTGHCTGQKAFDLMKPLMGDSLVQMHCGMELVL